MGNVSGTHKGNSNTHKPYYPTIFPTFHRKSRPDNTKIFTLITHPPRIDYSKLPSNYNKDDVIRNHVAEYPDSINVVGYECRGPYREGSFKYETYQTFTPLYYACYYCDDRSLDVIKLLIELGADPGWAPKYEVGSKDNKSYMLNRHLQSNETYTNILPMVIKRMAAGDNVSEILAYLLSIGCDNVKGNPKSYSSLMTVCSLINVFDNLRVFRLSLIFNVNPDIIVDNKSAHTILCSQLITSKSIQAKVLLEHYCKRVVI